MPDQYHHIIVERHGNVACARLVKTRLDENEIHELTQELMRLGREEGCPRIALSLGPNAPDCLYSVFLARLISLQRRLGEIGGGLKLCECPDQVLEIFDACLLLDRFDFVATPNAALADWNWGIPTVSHLNGPPGEQQSDPGR
jgi:hypothetical protein